MNDYQCEREIQRTLLLKQVMEEWHDWIHTIEIEKQAYNASFPALDEDKDDSKDEIDTTPLVFEGRSRIASVLFGALTTQTRLEALGLDLCIQAITDMADLCPLREAPRQQKRSWNNYIEVHHRARFVSDRLPRDPTSLLSRQWAAITRCPNLFVRSSRYPPEARWVRPSALPRPASKPGLPSSIMWCRFRRLGTLPEPRTKDSQQ